MKGLYLSEMSSWYVERLLLDRHDIRGRLFENSEGRNAFVDNSYVSTLRDGLSNDTYLDLLEVETKIKEMVDKGLFGNYEFKVLDLILEGHSISDIESLTSLSRRLISTTYKRLCGKIAFHLGDHFTNEGYTSYMIEKYDLNNEQIEILEEQLYSSIRLRK